MQSRAKIPFVELRVKFQIAAPAGQGPDIITGPQDWIGAFAAADLIDNLKENEFSPQELKQYNQVGLQNLIYEGKLYGIPSQIETIVVMGNKALMKSEPATMDELLAQAAAFNGSCPGKYGFFYDVNNLYFSWPILAGFGSQISGKQTERWILTRFCSIRLKRLQA